MFLKREIFLVITTCFMVSIQMAYADIKENNKNEMGTVIGIDLGTTYSCVGVVKNGQVEIIANDQGNRITPSYVAFSANGERLIGDAAKNQLTSNPENTVFDAKRLIGREFNDPSVQADLKYWPFKIVNKKSKPHVQVESSGEKKIFSAEALESWFRPSYRPQQFLKIINRFYCT